MRGTWGKKSKFGRNTTGIQLECDRPATLLRSPEAVAGCSDLGVFHPKVSASWRTYLPRVLDRKADASSCGSRDQAFLNDGVEVWSAHIRGTSLAGETNLAACLSITLCAHDGREHDQVVRCLLYCLHEVGP